MKRWRKIIFGIGSAVLLAILTGVLIVRELFLGQKLYEATSPNNPHYHVEFYEHPGFIGAPVFSVFVIDGDRKKYLADIDLGDPSGEDIFSSGDGAVVFCKGTPNDSAYDFTTSRKYSPNETSKILSSLLAVHGGQKSLSILEAGIIERDFVWCDFVPRENN